MRLEGAVSCLQGAWGVAYCLLWHPFCDLAMLCKVIRSCVDYIIDGHKSPVR